MKKTLLRNYARLIARTGARIQKGQEVLLFAQLDQPEFIEILVDECYKAGASRVDVEWSWQPLKVLDTRYRTLKSLSKIEDWEFARLEHRTVTLPVRIYILSEDPDGLARINKEKHAKAVRAVSTAVKPYRDRADNRYQWCIAAVPGKSWAKKVFPGMRTSQAVEKLWEAILSASRALNDDPSKAWEEHNAELKKLCAYINSLGLTELHYTAGNGTDLRVGLMPQAEFLGGGESTLSGAFFNPNIPSEEIFITPKKGEAEGVIYSSKPFSYRGQLINSFMLRFEKGRVCEIRSDDAQEVLEKMISLDDGASMLGECALVPYDSPISNSGILFYNTLFDENAACHLALGEGFTNCVKDYDKYTLEELREMGVNDSIIHEDIMIGTPDLSIDGITASGETVPIFRDGNFVI
ncbi:MAG: aminopeptidase [Clostridia bacterium]|nr:aminopeptidase [Clostridia bacterium]